MHNIHSLNDLCKNSVLAVEMRCGRMRDEPLCTFRVFARGGHANTTGLVFALTEFGANGIILAAKAIAAITAGLYYEVRNHTMEIFLVEVAAVHELHEVNDGARELLR